MGIAHQFLVSAGAEPQLLVLSLEPSGLDRALDHQEQPIGLERLLDEIVGTHLDRSDGGLDGAVAADHHHGKVGCFLARHAQDLDAIELATLEPDVEHQQRGQARTDRGQRL